MSHITITPPDQATLETLQPITLEVVQGEPSAFASIWIRYAGSDEDLLVYNGTSFVHPFDDNSTLVRPHSDDSFLIFSVVPEGGWLGSLDELFIETANIPRTIATILGATDPGQTIVDIMDHTSKPTWLYAGSDPNGAEELITGIDDLTDYAPELPDKEVIDAILNATTTQFDHDTNQAMDAASSSVGDIGEETITLLWLGRFLEASQDRDLWGKRTAGLGWELRKSITSGQVTWGCNSASGLLEREIAVDHGTANPQAILATRSWVNDVQSLWSREGADEGTRHQETLTNAETMGIGEFKGLAAGANFALGAGWRGTGGDNMNNTHRLKLAQWLGWES